MVMIEIIYKEESKTEAADTCFAIPNNIRQIGESKGSQKIYMEDYAYTFLRKISRGAKDGKIAVLLGEHHWSQGTAYLFIKSALQLTEMEVSAEHLDFTDKVWGSVYEVSRKYFPNQEILGWFLSLPGVPLQPNGLIVKTHLDYFAGNDKVLFLVEPGEWDEAFYVYENGQMNRQTGYYIYYEKNEPMQSYMIEMSQNKSIEETENIPDRAVVNFRKNVKTAKIEKKKAWTTGAYVALAVLAVGVAAYSRSDELQKFVLSAFEREQDTESGDEQEVSAKPQNTPTPTQGADGDGNTNSGSLNNGSGDGSGGSNHGSGNGTGSNEGSGNGDNDADDGSSNGTGNSDYGSENGNEGSNSGSEDAAGGSNNGSGGGNSSTQGNGDAQADTSALEQYIVKKGDTLSSISLAQYGTKSMVDEICRINNISNEDIILPGQKLALPGKYGK